MIWSCGGARELALTTYRLTSSFPRAERFGLVPQLRRASISVISNIAECHGRATRRDRVHFLVMARGSLYELQAQFDIAGALEFVASEKITALDTAIVEITRMLNGLIRYYGRKL